MQVLIRFLALFTALVPAACDSGVMGPSLEDFKKVEEGMTRGEIHDLVGNPSTDAQPDNAEVREVWVTGNYKLSVDYEGDEAARVQVAALDGSGVPGEDDDQSAEPATPDKPADEMQQPSETP